MVFTNADCGEKQTMVKTMMTLWLILQGNACKYSRSECTLIFGAQMQILTLCSLSLPPSQHYKCTLSFLHTQHYEEGESVNLHLGLKNKSALRPGILIRITL